MDQLNQRGHDVTVFERDDRLGGLLMYGIPNMKLEKDIVKRRTDLMSEEGITFVTGQNGADKKFVKKVLADFDAVIVGGGGTGNNCVGTCIRHGCKSVVQQNAAISKLPKTITKQVQTKSSLQVTAVANSPL